MKQLLVKYSNWKLIVPVLLGFIYCIYLFAGTESQLSKLAGEKVTMIDMMRDYSEADIISYLDKIGEEGRYIHNRSTLFTDMVFPATYGLLFILLAAFFLKKIFGPDSYWLYLALVPLLLMIMDYTENFKILDMLDKYPNFQEGQVSFASSVTSIKNMLTNVSMLLPLVLGISWGVIWMLRRNEKK